MSLCALDHGLALRARSHGLTLRARSHGCALDHRLAPRAWSHGWVLSHIFRFRSRPVLKRDLSQNARAVLILESHCGQQPRSGEYTVESSERMGSRGRALHVHREVTPDVAERGPLPATSAVTFAPALLLRTRTGAILALTTLVMTLYLLPRRRLRAEEPPEEAHRDGAREAQGSRVPLLPRAL